MFYGKGWSRGTGGGGKGPVGARACPEGCELSVTGTPCPPLSSPPWAVPQHKKLVEGNLYEEVSTASYSENDISNSIKNGILYLEDPIDHVRVSLPMAARGRAGSVRQG